MRRILITIVLGCAAVSACTLYTDHEESPTTAPDDSDEGDSPGSGCGSGDHPDVPPDAWIEDGGEPAWPDGAPWDPDGGDWGADAGSGGGSGGSPDGGEWLPDASH